MGHWQHHLRTPLSCKLSKELILLMLEVSTFVWSSKFIFQDTWEGTSFLMQRLQVIIAVQKNPAPGAIGFPGSWTHACWLAGWIIALVSMISVCNQDKTQETTCGYTKERHSIIAGFAISSKSNSLLTVHWFELVLLYLSVWWVVRVKLCWTRKYRVHCNLQYVLGPFPQNIQSLTKSQHFKKPFPTSSWWWICLNAGNTKKCWQNLAATCSLSLSRELEGKFMYHCVNWETIRYSQRMVTMNASPVQWKWWDA